MSTYTRSAYSQTLSPPVRSTGKSRSGTKSSYGSPKQKAVRKKSMPFPQFKVAPGKVILWSLVAGICGFFYITHVFTTQQLLQEVSEVRLEHDKVRSLHDDRVLTYERLTGPAAVFTRARELGYEQSGPADYIILKGN